MVVVGFLKDYDTMISSLYIDVFVMKWKLVSSCMYCFIIHSEIIMFAYYPSSSFSIFYQRNFYALNIIFGSVATLMGLCYSFLISHYLTCRFLHGNLSHSLVLYVSLIRRLAFFLVRNIQSNHGIIPSQYQIFG